MVCALHAFQEQIAIPHVDLLPEVTEGHGGWYPWGAQPEHYANAWRHIHDLFEEEGVNQYIQWV